MSRSPNWPSNRLGRCGGLSTPHPSRRSRPYAGGAEMRRSEVHRLDPTRQYWVPAVVAPQRDWEGAPGCTRGARFMVEARTLRASREEFETFESELHCLRWIM